MITTTTDPNKPQLDRLDRIIDGLKKLLAAKTHTP